MKTLYTSVFLLLASLVYGQKSTLYQNVNVRAKELKHNLNRTGDSLILKCERTIYEVVIFNDDFERVVRVRDKETIIPIADVPVGRFIVEALLSDKLIVITLLRNEPFELPDAAPIVADTSDLFGTKTTAKEEVIVSVETPVIEEEIIIAEVKAPEPEITNTEIVTKKADLAVAGKKAEKKPRLTRKVAYTKPKQPAESSLSLFKAEEEATAEQPRRRSTRDDDDGARANRIVSKYWVEYRINNGQNSQKVLKLGDQDTVDRMIRKVEIDKKTKAGRLNELIIWTVYDPTKFVKHKKMNKDNFTSVPSDSFKIEPYYAMVNDPSNI